MARALFITTKDLKKSTAINGNIDVSKLIPAIKIAQELEVEPLLGTDLYDKINDEIVAGTLSGATDYQALVTNYLHDILIHYALYYYLPYASYQVTNGGVSKWNGGENHDSIETSELSILTNREKSIAEEYKARLLNHLCENSTLYPEYSTNTGDDIDPIKSGSRGGLYLN